MKSGKAQHVMDLVRWVEYFLISYCYHYYWCRYYCIYYFIVILLITAAGGLLCPSHESDKINILVTTYIDVNNQD